MIELFKVGPLILEVDGLKGRKPPLLAKFRGKAVNVKLVIEVAIVVFHGVNSQVFVLENLLDTQLTSNQLTLDLLATDKVFWTIGKDGGRLGWNYNFPVW